MPYRPDAALQGALVVEDRVKPAHVVIMGGPGSGKTTICRSLCEKYGMVHISVGDVLREKVRQKTESSDLIAEYMVEGRLVPDELAISIVRERINSPEVQERGWMLDNFPRTSDQAEAMMELGIIPDKFIFVNVPEDVLMSRCLNRRIDPETGAIYDLKTNPPVDAEIQKRLIKRDDDNEDAITRRLELFFEGSEDVLEIFNDIKLELDGCAPMKPMLKAAHLYVKPPAPLYADVSTRPADVSADALREQFSKRAEESKAREPAEGEEAAEAEDDDQDAAGRPPLLGDDFRRRLAGDMIDLCLGELFDEEQERSRVRRLTYQFAAQHAMGSLDTLVRVLFLAHDEGDQAADPSWSAGDEPLPAVVDTWGRGVVPLKRRLKPLTVEEVQGGETRPASARSGASRKSGATAATGAPAAAKKKEDKKGKKEDKKKEDKKKAPEEMSTEDKLRALLKAKNDEAAAKASKAKQYADAVEKMEKQIKSLTSRGQTFTMDSKGDVMLVNELSGDKIPGPNVAVKSGLAPAPRPPEDPKFNAAAGGGAAPPAKYFIPSDTVQPPAVESHVLATGVTLKEGGQTREGPPRAKDSVHMTRKEYTAIIQAENPSLGASLRMTAEEEQVEEEEEEEALQGGSSSPGGMAAASGAIPLVAGGVPLSTAGLIAGGAPLAAGGQAAAVSTKAEVAEAVVYDWDKTDFYDKEKQIVPEDQRFLKPDKKAVLKSVGARPKNPRDRFIHPHAVVAKDYLPPPIFPGSYGHGVVTSYLADQNQFIRDEAMLKQRLNASLASASSPNNTLSPLKSRKPLSNEGSFVEGESVQEGTGEESLQLGGAQPRILVDYPKNFPKGKPSTVTTVNAKLMRDAGNY